LVHSDVCSPLKENSFSGAAYFVTFIDDHSRKLWAYSLKTKNEVLEKFKQFQVMVERQTRKKLKCIRSDNGGEYHGPFDEYCEQQGIKHEKTPPKIPQLNGLAKRMNTTIIERVRCMLNEAKLPKRFWGEALITVVHVINLSPAVALDDNVPDNVWFGKNISYDHLRVFGCKAFVHVPNDERFKLDMKTKQCIFIGYGQDKHGYKLYDPVNKKLMRSRDVIFLEFYQTIEDIEKMEKDESKQSGDLVNRDPVQLDNEHAEDHPDAPIDDVGNDSHEILVDSSIPLKRSTRERQPSTRYPSDEYVTLTDEGKPGCFEKAMDSQQKEKLVNVMQDEMQSLHDNQTFDLVKLPKGKRALQNMWIYRLKHEGNSSSLRYKARLVVKGFRQKKGIDYDEIFSPVVKMSSIRTILSLTASLDLEIENMDVKTAFLYGDLE